MKKEKIGIYIVCLAVIGGLLYLLISGIRISGDNYREGVELANSLFDAMVEREDVPFRPDVPMLYAMHNARALDAATIKYSAVFLGYLVVFIGGIFVIYGAEAIYKLNAQGQGIKGSLETASPGLVLITLGAILVLASIWSRSSFDTQVDWGSAPLHVTLAGALQDGDGSETSDPKPLNLNESERKEYEAIVAP